MELEQLRDVQMIQTSILKEFIKVCESLHLRYFVSGGTAIGVVRHSGFIPWDDDIDVGLLREDYEIFIKSAQSLLPPHLFLQHHAVDSNYLALYAKIRDSNTTFIERSVEKVKQHHGIFIDVFPYDYVPEGRLKKLRFDFLSSLYNRRLDYSRHEIEARGIKRVCHLLVRGILRFFFPSAVKVVHKLEKLYKSVPKSDMLKSHEGKWGNKVIPADWIETVTSASFEGIEVNLMSRYHEYLSYFYDDYMTPPPVEKQIPIHDTVIIDTKRSYKIYIDNV